ncbi:MAG: hypothetical protein ACRDOB_11230 [Streptosporangiaceae bacterium]
MLAVAVVAVTAIGILTTRSAASLGNTLADDELTTSTVTAQLARSIDAAYAAGAQAAQAAQPAAVPAARLALHQPAPRGRRAAVHAGTAACQ